MTKRDKEIDDAIKKSNEELKKRLETFQKHLDTAMTEFADVLKGRIPGPWLGVKLAKINFCYDAGIRINADFALPMALVALNDKRPDVRRAGVHAVEKLADAGVDITDAIPQIIEILKSDDLCAISCAADAIAGYMEHASYCSPNCLLKILDAIPLLFELAERKDDGQRDFYRLEKTFNALLTIVSKMEEMEKRSREDYSLPLKAETKQAAVEVREKLIDLMERRLSQEAKEKRELNLYWRNAVDRASLGYLLNYARTIRESKLKEKSANPLAGDGIASRPDQKFMKGPETDVTKSGGAKDKLPTRRTT